jgi:hypothetical protein
MPGDRWIVVQGEMFFHAFCAFRFRLAHLNAAASQKVGRVCANAGPRFTFAIGIRPISRRPKFVINAAHHSS